MEPLETAEVEINFAIGAGLDQRRERKGDIDERLGGGRFCGRRAAHHGQPRGGRARACHRHPGPHTYRTRVRRHEAAFHVGDAGRIAPSGGRFNQHQRPVTQLGALACRRGERKIRDQNACDPNACDRGACRGCVGIGEGAVRRWQKRIARRFGGGGGKVVFGDRRRSIIRSLQKMRGRSIPCRSTPAFHAG